MGPGGDAGPPLSSVPRGRSKTNALNISQKMIEMFVRTKHKIDKCHEFALVVVNNDATWVSGAAGTGPGPGLGTALCPPHPGSSQLSGFTSDPREVCSCLYDLETVVCKSFSIPPPVGLGRGAGTLQGPLGVNEVPWVQTGSLEHKRGPSRPVACRWQQIRGLAGIPGTAEPAAARNVIGV